MFSCKSSQIPFQCCSYSAHRGSPPAVDCTFIHPIPVKWIEQFAIHHSNLTMISLLNLNPPLPSSGCKANLHLSFPTYSTSFSSFIPFPTQSFSSPPSHPRPKALQSVEFTGERRWVGEAELRLMGHVKHKHTWTKRHTDTHSHGTPNTPESPLN